MSIWWCLVVPWWCHDAVKRKWSASAAQTTRRIVHCAALVAPRFSVQAIASKKPTRRPCINLLSPAAHPVSLTLLSSSPITVSVVFPKMPAIAHYVKYTTFQTRILLHLLQCIQLLGVAITCFLFHCHQEHFCPKKGKICRNWILFSFNSVTLYHHFTSLPV